MKIRNTKLSKKTIAFAAAAVLLLASGGFMGTRALPNVESDQVEAPFGMSDLAVVLHENGEALIGSREEAAPLALDKLDKDSNGQAMVVPGKLYKETLAAENKSSHDQYVRIILRKYWISANGKDTALTPDMITINTGKGWAKSSKESTKETEVLYYKEKLAGGETSPAAITGIRISDAVLDAVEVHEEAEQVGGKTIITYAYSFDGCHIGIEAELQAVQTHNAKEAIVSVWGNDAPKPNADGSLQVQ